MPRAKGGSIPPPRPIVPPGYGGAISTLNENDVLSGRGGRINNHPGNIMFRTVVEDYKKEYLDPRTRKLEKAHVAARLVTQIRSANPPGRFLREDPDNPGKFVEIGDTKAWKKAGQALREDAPDVRKEIDEDMEMEERYTPQPMFQPGMPHGVPPAVSFSPATGPIPFVPSPGHRPDPPASGESGYRQPPLPYLESGRGSGGVRAWAGRGPPPPPPPRQPQYQQQNMGQPPPSNQVFPGQRPNHPQGTMHHHPGYPPPNYYGQHPPTHVQHNPHQPYPHPQYPPYGHQNHQPNGRPYPPQSMPPTSSNEMPPPQDRTPKSTSPVPPILSRPINAVASGVSYTLDAVSGLSKKVKSRVAEDGHVSSKKQVGFNQDFPLVASTGTNFTMSDVSEIGDSKIFSSVQEGQPALNESIGSYSIKPPSVGENTKSSSGKSRDTTMSEFSISGFKWESNNSLGYSFGNSGRTRSFPDLMLSTDEPPLPSLHVGDSDKNSSDNNDAVRHTRTKSGRLLRPSSYRASSSESSGSDMASIRFDRNFHPVRSRNNTALSISALNDGMSVMSLESRRSLSVSDNSTWLEAFKSMQSITSDVNPWDVEGSLRPQAWNDDGSIRSLLTDVSSDLNALDLAEPLLPPYPTDSWRDDSAFITKPDP